MGGGGAEDEENRDNKPEAPKAFVVVYAVGRIEN